MMENIAAQGMEQSEVDIQRNVSKVQPQAESNRPNWSNGQCVLAMRSFSALNPSFDLSLCRARLRSSGFQIPVTDMEVPLAAALNVPAIRRYMVFNSAVFHFILAPVLYVVLWCALFSTLHLYIIVTDYWVLCLCVSLVAIFLTTAIIFILHNSNKEITVNLDVRLIQVNEKLVKHKLLVAVADCLQNCAGHMQLYFVYWDMSHCLRTLTNTLEECSYVATDIQKKLRRKMAHLVLVSEAKADASVTDLDLEQGSEEHRPLLGAESEPGGSRSAELKELSANYSLIPDASLPAQTKAYQLLMTYSAVYMKLLMSQRLSAPTHHCLRPLRNHCTTAPFCLCQYIKRKILQ